MKQELSLLEVTMSLGFIYWINESSDLRGLKHTSILEYPQKIKELQKEYSLKYPNGLTGWSN